MTRLHNGQMFPQLEIPLTGGGTIKLPEALAGQFGVVLIYRGAWCPFCNTQLAAFERASEKFADIGIKVVAFSVDDEATTTALVAKHHLRFPVGYGVDAGQIAAATGAYTNDTPSFLQTTGFVLTPNGSVINAVYSSGPIGRLVPDDVAGLVSYIKSKA
ncbi:peroxiredoxin family protein [Mesorhizobium sp. INR15]|uniref:peroxiredoxin family protein n=1 Tax=Mesorhizobium sp. INR15 TaxID=2654248 RepID=UPI0018966B78|nr:peroxiredoxin family protein [Mesorhizobium sp. INR15]QPC90955.1 redoxin domain-containing protein [Mesorhizobium sp. INR15]